MGLVFFLLRLYSLSLVSKLNLYSVLNKFFLSFILYLFFVMFLSLNLLLNYYQDLCLVNFDLLDSLNTYIFSITHQNFFNINSVSLNLVQVYYYPFIYVFILVTLLSVIFCLSYNKDEFMTFIFYCKLILASGYILFFTDSI